MTRGFTVLYSLTDGPPSSRSTTMLPASHGPPHCSNLTPRSTLWPLLLHRVHNVLTPVVSLKLAESQLVSVKPPQERCVCTMRITTASNLCSCDHAVLREGLARVPWNDSSQAARHSWMELGRDSSLAPTWAKCVWRIHSTYNNALRRPGYV